MAGYDPDDYQTEAKEEVSNTKELTRLLEMRLQDARISREHLMRNLTDTDLVIAMCESALAETQKAIPMGKAVPTVASC